MACYLFGVKPLPEPMLSFSQTLRDTNLMKHVSQYNNCPSRKCIWKFQMSVIWFRSLCVDNWHCLASLQWRHNEGDGVWNHRRLHCLLRRLYRRRSKKISKLRVTGLCEGNSSATDSPHKVTVTRKMFPFPDVIMMFQVSVWIAPSMTSICVVIRQYHMAMRSSGPSSTEPTSRTSSLICDSSIIEVDVTVVMITVCLCHVLSIPYLMHVITNYVSNKVSVIQLEAGTSLIELYIYQ